LIEIKKLREICLGREWRFAIRLRWNVSEALHNDS